MQVLTQRTAKSKAERIRVPLLMTISHKLTTTQPLLSGNNPLHYCAGALAELIYGS